MYYIDRMKSATIPPVRIAPQLREELEQSLREGETLAGLVESAVRQEVQRRKEHSEFVRRGLAALQRSRETGDSVPASVVIAKLESRLAAARKVRKPRKA